MEAIRVFIIHFLEEIQLEILHHQLDDLGVHTEFFKLYLPEL